ncbi:MAG TPA: prolipoprotein diacylglyceryl transferase family protein [Terracidiphilus sp.]|jgi:phosphatidylglycerol:prolipoprotein diacylglycerol transferase|nr:prolipoprotein diacylglyceryl transferase family protein [Terracidiphilus sp.]
MRWLYTPAMLRIGSHPLWHPVFETVAYTAGYAIFRFQRARQGDILQEPQRWTILAAAAVGALLGSRFLGIAEQFPTVLAAWQSGHLLALLMAPGGKTIVGGLLGGWLGVELVKSLSGIHSRTGDLFALPLCIGIAIGRIGCFLAGLADDTYGKPTSLPWAVDFGDGIGRHPVQLYEILFLLCLAAFLAFSRRWPLKQGARFRIFLAAYLAWRLLIDCIKSQPLIAGLNLIQWCCAAGLIILSIDHLLDQSHRNREADAHVLP